MATNSSILAWKIPWTKEPRGLQFTGSQRFGHEFLNHFCCCSVAQSCLTFVTLWAVVRQASLSSNISQSLFKLMSIRSVISHPTISSSVIPFSFRLQSFPASGVFSNELTLRFKVLESKVSVSSAEVELQYQSFQCKPLLFF